MAESGLLQKLEDIKVRFDEVGELIAQPEAMADMKRFVALSKEYRELETVVEAHKKYADLLSNIASAQDIVANESDEEMRAMAKEELDELLPQVDPMEEEIKLLLLPSDPQDSKNALVEIRGGTGGDEAALFAGDLYRMYQHFAETRGWKIEVSSFNEGTMGGFKEIVFNLSGEGVYGVMKYESGVHRVQRVPATETQGRVHTSAASVVVLPEAEEFDIDLKMEDIRKDTYCSSGPGGQSVNTTYSAVRLTHIPTNIVVQCQDQKSQIKNFEKALVELRSRLYSIEYQKYLDGIASQRKTMVSTGDRSAKIRTYNFPQGRVTDHRINYTVYNLQGVLNGDIQGILDQLQIAENAERLRASGI
ncbi:MAG: peptide chain release factor 1 [Bacteroidetes bacterium]|nr:MAG: peptide chain release factor 1 [Bacteroidota bacterium]